MNRTLKHIIFWLGIIVFTTFNWLPYIENTSFIIYSHLILIFTVFLPSYINIEYLVPNYLQKKKYIIYTILLIVLILLQTIYIWTFMSTLVYFFGKQDVIFINYYPTPWKLVSYILLYQFYFAAGKFISEFFKNQKRIDEIKQKNLEIELNLLKNQINPHFLFNSINIIYAYSLKNSKDTSELILKLSDMLRYLLYENNTDKVSLEKEINYIKTYIEFAKLRARDKSIIKLNINGNTENKEICPMIFIPFIENSIKYGIFETLENPFVSINLTIKDKLVFTVKNNYKKIDKLAKGIGIENTKRRLELFYKNNYNLSIKDKGKTFKVELEIYEL